MDDADGGVGADAFALDHVRDRIRAAVDARDLTRINTELGTIQVAVVDEDLALAAAARRTAAAHARGTATIGVTLARSATPGSIDP